MQTSKLREATADGCRGPVILLTGQGDRSVDIEATKAGAADYLGKPWDDELETFRYAGDGAPVRWLHQVV